ncbi:hypothetical protein [Geobacter sp.]|uniref:hypothetical protein n=1 Tax=Geobacter sp. TaxID=46610 RepID=UPI0027BAA4D2|nr:hypothetical protein [Geobacter sp.]
MAAHAPEAPVSLGGEETPADAPAVAERARVEPTAATGSDTSVIRLREEGGGQPVSVGESPLQSGAVTRQVVGPSPSEHAPVAGIPEVTVKGVVLPNPVKREQADCESDRTVSGDFRVEQMESFHDGGSNDVPAVSVSASDSFVRESSSGYAALQTGKVSVETQGRRQAGVSRAGSTTPPGLLSSEAAENPAMGRSAEPVAVEPLQAGVEALPAPQFPRNPPPSATRAGQASQPGEVPEETGRPAVPQGREPLEETHPDPPSGAVPASVTLRQPPAPAIGEQFHRPPERRMAPPEPQVRIGTIEVVVVAPAPVERSPRSEERTRPDLASRHYLRNF